MCCSTLVSPAPLSLCHLPLVGRVRCIQLASQAQYCRLVCLLLCGAVE